MRSLTPTAFVAAKIGDPLRTSLGDCLASRYVMLQLLGRGSASRVFLARDERTSGLVAVKVMPPYGSMAVVTKERFDAEIAVGRGVPHRNVARVLDSGMSEWGEPFVVTEALAGETLGDRLRRERGPFAECRRRGCLRSAWVSPRSTLTATYRDVKPDNLFLCNRERHDASVKVIDFGFCTPLEQVDEADGRVMGTLEYIAPEQAVAETVDGRADVYARRVVLFARSRASCRSTPARAAGS